VSLIHETLIRSRGKNTLTGKAEGYWNTLYQYIEKNYSRGFYRDQLARQSKIWKNSSFFGKWWYLAGWSDLNYYRRFKLDSSSVDGRFLSWSRRIAWFQASLLVIISLLLIESYWWTSKYGFPLSYMLNYQKFRLMKWGWLDEPLPRMIEIPPPSEGSFKMGLDKSGEAEGKKQSLIKLGVWEEKLNFYYPEVKVELSSQFMMSKSEITYEMYDYFIWVNTQNNFSLKYPSSSNSKRGKTPVANISVNNIMEYISWLNKKIRRLNLTIDCLVRLNGNGQRVEGKFKSGGEKKSMEWLIVDCVLRKMTIKTSLLLVSFCQTVMVCIIWLVMFGKLHLRHGQVIVTLTEAVIKRISIILPQKEVQKMLPIFLLIHIYDLKFRGSTKMTQLVLEW